MVAHATWVAAPALGVTETANWVPRLPVSEVGKQNLAADLQKLLLRTATHDACYTSELPKTQPECPE